MATVVFRADASAQIGSGHVMRCVALATALTSMGVSCRFLCRDLEGNLLQWIAEQGFEAFALSAGRQFDARADAAATAASLGDDLRPSWLVVDHYGIDAQWEQLVRPSIGRMLVVDDLANRRHVADLLVDQNLQPAPGRYLRWVPRTSTTLLGPRFALLRPEFAAVREQYPLPRSTEKPRILACMGGTDPKDALSTVLAAWTLLPAPPPALDIAVGCNSPNLEKLRQNCAGLDGVHLHVQTTEMAALMARSRMLVGTAGSISWERCCIGLAAIMGVTADNQRSNLHVLAEKRTGIAVGDWEATSPDALAATMQGLLSRPALLDRLAARAHRLVDGRGAQRVAAVMLRESLALRPAVASDATLAWPWRNAESTRRHFRNPAALDYGAHVAWWNAVLSNGDSALLIGMIGDMPVGVLRLDRKGAQAKVSVYLDPALTGLGLGPTLLRAGLGWSRQHLNGVERLSAEVVPENHASLSAFRAAGFTRDGAGQWTHEV